LLKPVEYDVTIHYIASNALRGISNHQVIASMRCLAKDYNTFAYDLEYSSIANDRFRRSRLPVTLARRAGSAVLWRGLSVSIEKIVFLVRILVLARLVAPAEFGLVAIGMVSLAIMVSLTDFGIIPALVQLPARRKRHLDTAWTIGVIRGAGINIVMLLAAPYIASAFGAPDATNIIRMLAVATLLQSAASIEIATLTRELKFKRLVMIRLLAAVCNTAVSILLASRLGAWAIVWGAVSGAVTYLIVSYVVAPYRPRFRMQGAVTSSLMRFGRWIFLIGVISVTADAAIRWIITQRLGVTELGLFFMAARLAYLPQQLITELVSEVAFPLYSQLQRDSKKAVQAFRTLFLSTLALLLPASGLLIVLIPNLVDVVLGDRWTGATHLMQLMVLVAVVGVAGDTVLPLLKGMGRPKQVAILDLIQLLLLVPIGWLLVGHFGLTGAGLAILVTVGISQVFAVRFAGRLISSPFSGTMASSAAIVGSALIGASVAAVLTESFSGLTALLTAAIGGTIAIAITGLLLDTMFELRLLSRMAEPFPILARLVPGARSGRGGTGNRDEP
jgi:O-antigen/teichoic acid export membrane protein